MCEIAIIPEGDLSDHKVSQVVQTVLLEQLEGIKNISYRL